MGPTLDTVFDSIYTKDSFICGLCSSVKYTIEEYVNHMLTEEQCALVLHPYSDVKDLLLPRFRRTAKSTQNPDIDLRAEKVVNLSESTETPEKKTSNKESVNASTLAFEIDTGEGTRWKCRLCFLTFSRQAAFFNHFRLQHELKREYETITECHSNSEISTVKREPSECGTNILVSEDTNIPNEINLNIVKKCELPPTCQICGQIFKTDRILVSHIGIVHSENRPFICDINSCNISFKTKGSLIRHQRRHTGERPYECLRCGRRYRESGSLLRHHQSRVSCMEKPEKCLPRYGLTLPFAAAPVDSKGDLKLHLAKPLKKEDRPGTSFEKVHKDNAEPTATLCEETKASVRLQIHSEKAKKYSDTQSKSSNALHEKKPLLNVKDLKKELVSHEDQRENICTEVPSESMKPPLSAVLRRSFTCPVCYRSYVKEVYLSSHMKVHLAELGTECPTCNKNFNSDHALARHLLSHSDARQFECNICGKPFKLKSHAVSHLRSHSYSKTVPCLECGRLFKSVSSRNNHMKIHMGEKKFECAVCFRKFLVKASLERHQRIHSDEKPFHCPNCHRRFREHGTLSRHLKNKQSCGQLGVMEEKKEPGHGLVVCENVAPEETSETLEVNDAFSEAGSELNSYISEKVDLSSIYSDPSDVSFDPEDYLIPPLQSFEPLYKDIKMEHCSNESSRAVVLRETSNNFE